MNKCYKSQQIKSPQKYCLKSHKTVAWCHSPLLCHCDNTAAEASLLTSPIPNPPASSDQPQCCDWSLCRRDCCPQRRKAEKVARLLLTLVEEEGWEGVLSPARSPSSPVPDFCTSSDPSPSLNTLSSICWVVMCRFCRNSGNRNIEYYLTPCPCIVSKLR